MSWLSDTTGVNLDSNNKKVSINPTGLTQGAAALFGGIPGLAFDAATSGGSGDAPAAPPPDQTLEAVRAQQKKDANDFVANEGKYKDQVFSNVDKSARSDLARNIANTRSSYNNRGLLYSGMRQGAELGNQAQAGAKLAGARSKINQAVEDQGKQMQYQAVDAGLQAQKSAQSIQDEIYSNALSDFQGRNNVIGSVLSGGGMIAGSALAKGQK